ncbi:L-type lectin-domain containing receptor kinase SIT2-like [Aegilops tauschii subsp. strangulata]|nr:L-type lectin-domain containing receptor kinase SIT2-like [Aegilops tauschii subsp. strangulata]
MPMLMTMSGIKHLSFLLFKLLLSLGLSVAPPFVAADEHQFSYSGFSNTNLTLDGAASVTPNGLLMLTNGTSRSMGRAFYPDPLRFHNLSNGAVQSFCVSFVFAMVSIYKDLSSNGIAMFIAPSKNLSTAMRMQYLGLLSNQNDGNQTNHIFAIELDTFQNWELQDMNDNHVGIDINSLRSIQSHDAGFYHDKNGTFQSLSLDSQEVMQVWVDYHGEKMQIDATMAPLGMAKPTRPIVSANYNLSSVLTDVAYIGFSSAEGKITKHYVLGWSFGMNSPAPAINLTMLPKLPLGPRSKGGRRRLWVLEIILPLATAALILSVAAVVSLLVRRHFRYAEVRDDWEVEYGPHRFSYKDLFRATEGFDNKNLLGTGGFGRVYRGELSRSKLMVAVKRVSHDSRQGMKEFIAEIVSIGRLQNPNLVHLLGYCRRQGELLLVYEYMPKGSLDKYLYGEVDNSTLSWDQRIWIIRGIASALIYLHEEWEKVVVHRDIKASNVLLDDELNARLGDFGLARLYDHGVEQETTRVVGTIGYIAPELARTGKGTPLTDVFAFGVFILEVTCGQRPIMQSTQDEQVMLVDWALEHVQQGSLDDAIDIRLKGQYNASEAHLALKLGLLCSHPFACARPSMRQVIQYLDGHIEPPQLPAHQSFQALALMQNEGFDSYIMSYPSSKSVGTMSSISGGR